MNETGRVTRKGQRLLIQTPATDREAPTLNPSGASRVGAFHDPRLPLAFGATERMANRRTLQQRQEEWAREQHEQPVAAATLVLSTAPNVRSPNEGVVPPSMHSAVGGGPIVGDSHTQPSNQEERNDSDPADRPENPRMRRKKWIYGAAILFVIFSIVLVLVIVLPIELQRQSAGGEDTPPSDMAPAQTPTNVPFVKFGPELVGENIGALLGASVEVVGDRWFAYGSPGHGINQSGLVRVVDMYNGTQIGQDIVGNTTEAFTGVGLFLSSAEGGWLAVSGRHSVRLLRYNYGTGLWESHGGVLSPEIQASSSVDRWAVFSISINSFVFGPNTIGLVVSSTDFTRNRHIHSFTIQVDHPSPQWQRLAPTLFFTTPGKTAYSSFVPGPRLMVAIYNDLVSLDTTEIVLYRLDGREWVRLPRVELALGRPFSSIKVLHRNSELTTIAFYGDNMIWLVETDIDMNVTAKGLPFESPADQDIHFSRKLAFSDDWVVHGATARRVRVFRRNAATNTWTQQGSDIMVRPGRQRVVEVALGGIPGSSKIVVVGLPATRSLRYEAVYLNSTDLPSSSSSTDGQSVCERDRPCVCQSECGRTRSRGCFAAIPPRDLRHLVFFFVIGNRGCSGAQRQHQTF